MPLRPPDTRPWQDRLVAELLPYLTGAITVSTPSTPGVYDPATGSRAASTPGATLISSRPARMRRMSEREASVGDRWRDVEKWRFTIVAPASVPDIPEGSVLHVDNGGRATEMTGRDLTVLVASRSSESPLLFITAKVD